MSVAGVARELVAAAAAVVVVTGAKCQPVEGVENQPPRRVNATAAGGRVDVEGEGAKTTLAGRQEQRSNNPV